MSRKIAGAYIYPCFANRSKIRKVSLVLSEYRKTAGKIAALQWAEFFQTGRFNRYLSLESVQSKLSARYKQTCLWQVVSVLESFTGNIQNRFRCMVYHSKLSEDVRKVLLFVNARKAWFDRSLEKALWKENKTTCEYKITEEHKKLARKIFKHILTRWRKPTFANIPMHLDQKVAVIEENRKSKTFDKWIKLSTLDSGKPVCLPLKNNPYAERLDGELLKFCQIGFDGDTLTVRLIKNLKDRKAEYQPKVEEIGIDLGLNPLFATDKGDLIGRNFLHHLKKLDEKITKRMSSVQRRGLKPSQDRKYTTLVGRLREFLKNEINRHLNRIVEIHKPKRIVVEKLDFRSPELSRRMNRLLSIFGKRYVNEKLNRLREMFGIEVVEVNPAYTSQTCSSCGYVDARNRKDANSFECKACGKKINAQVNGAVNILTRRSCGDMKPHHSKKRILKLLVKQYLERFKKRKRCNSAPLEVLRSNPYFRDFLNPEVVENKRL